MRGSQKEIMIAAVSGMVVYGALNEAILLCGVVGTTPLETELIRIVIPLIVAIAVLYLVFGLIIKVKKANKKSP
jgi:hypothetical protein